MSWGGLGSRKTLAELPRARHALSLRAIWQNELVGKWLKRGLGGMRRKQCMGSLTGALPFPAFGYKVRAESRVDYQNTSEGALVQRAQAGEETAFREIVGRYQSKVFSIIHGVVRQRAHPLLRQRGIGRVRAVLISAVGPV